MGSSTYALLANNIFSHWPTDYILILAALAFIALDALWNGPARASAVALALPFTFFILDAIPHTYLLVGISSQFSTPVLQTVLFAIILVPLYFLIHRILGFYADSSGPLDALIVGAASTAILLVFWMDVPALQTIWHFGVPITNVFGEAYRLWWLLGSFVALAFVRS
jgi:hypothetical protein